MKHDGRHLQLISRVALGLALGSSLLPLASASVSIYMPAEHLARRASLVVEGTVTRTASGFDRAHGSLATYITLEIETLHRGPADLAEVVIREPGGRWGDLVHDVDAVPIYSVGERVLVFLEPAADGALRTTGMFFGKFTLTADAERSTRAVRDLSGQGRIFGLRDQRLESFRIGDLVATAAGVPRQPAARRPGREAPPTSDSRPARPDRGDRWLPVPAEITRLEWDEVREIAGARPSAIAPTSGLADESLGRPAGPAAEPRFKASSATHPTRWQQTDSGLPVTVHIERTGDPLGDPAAAVSEVERAMAAWTDVPEARISVVPGNTNYNYTGSHGASPAASYSGINVVLFDDPYGDISDPTGCSGVLAIGGYWRSGSSGGTINSVSFYRALQLYVIFNDNFECYLGNPDNLAEVATHELGHGLGFGHSTTLDAIMRSMAYGNRGPRLGDDDRDAVHCHYPHQLSLVAPNGGESWQGGSLQSILWSSSAEAGADPGVVDIEYSTDGGGAWQPVASGGVNDGSHAWTVPDEPGTNVRLRVLRYPRADGAPIGYPESCSGDASNQSFTITEAPRLAGAVPDGSTGSPLVIGKWAGGELRLSWDPSCSADADGFAAYEGTLDALRSGSWDHQPLTCAAGPDVVEYVLPGAGDRFYLVAPLAGATEGRYGSSSSGQDRPASAAACGVREAAAACSP